MGAEISVVGSALLETDKLSISGLGADGRPAPLNFVRGSLGVDAGRYRFQVDYDPQSGRSETLKLDLNTLAASAELKLAMLGIDDGMLETGRWEAFGTDGSSVGAGWLDPAEHPDLRFPLSFSSPASRIELTATAYDRGDGADSMDNNSDYALAGITWMAVSANGGPVDSAVGPNPSEPTPSSGSRSAGSSGANSTPSELVERNVAGKDLADTDGVRILAYGTDGSETGLTVRHNAVGVSGGRYDYQLDYDPNTGSSEKVRIEFETGASNISLSTIMMGRTEWQGMAETGLWTAYDRLGGQIGSGSLDPSSVGQSRGKSVFALDLDQPAFAIEFVANAYGNGAGTDRLANNSDFALRALRWSEAG